MAYAKTDPLVLGFLGRALSLEMSAVQQNFSVTRLLKLRGFEDIAERFVSYGQREVAQVERIIGRMLTVGVAPNGTILRPARLGNSLPALVAGVYSLEAEIVHFYQQAVNHCARNQDFDNHLFFERLLQEAQAHANELSNWQQQEFAHLGRQSVATEEK